MITAIDAKPAHDPGQTWRREPPLVASADCTICRGTGWHLIPAGSGSRARRCTCGDLQRLHLIRDQVRIPERYQHCRIENFEPGQYSQFQALQAARRFIDRYPGRTRDLFFSGGPGVGKTHLAVGIVHDLIHRFHENICFVELVSFLEELPLGRRTTDVWNPLLKAQLLVLDNFGASSQVHPQVVCSLEQLLHQRWQMGRSMIFTGGQIEPGEVFEETGNPASEPTLALLSQLAPRTRARLLSCARIVAVCGIDHRKKSPDLSVLFR